MRFDERERLGSLLVQLDLELDRVGLDVDELAGLGVLGQWDRAAVKVEDQLGGTVEAAQPRL